MATTITIEQWRDQLARMVRSGAIRKGIRTAGASLAEAGRGFAMMNVTKGGSSGLRVRSGALRGSMGGTAKLTTSGVDVILKSGGSGGFGAVPYAKTHEEGKTITPTKGKYLAIPIHPELKTKASVGRVPGPRFVPGLFFIMSKKGNALLVKSVGKKVHGSGVEPWYLLLKSVTIPPRPFLQPALEKISGQADRVISDEIARVLEGKR